MSATNVGDTGHERLADDSYETPIWCTRAILAQLRLADPFHSVRVLDPCAGRGRILEAVRDVAAERTPDALLLPTLQGIELDAGRAEAARVAGFDVTQGDCLKCDWPIASLCITNPPFSKAMEVIQRSFAMCGASATYAFLLRLDWLATAGRAQFHREHPSDVYVLPRRPSFCVSITCKSDRCKWHVTQTLEEPIPAVCIKCGGKLRVTKSDASEYAWYCHAPGRGNRWFILEVESA
jgi:hypothetical protein